MTILEAKYLYGCKEYVSSVGDTLTTVVRRLYMSDDDLFYTILKRLNIRFDWSDLKPNSVILYFDEEVCQLINEV